MDHKKIIFNLTVTQPEGNIKFHGGGKYGEIVFKSLLNRYDNVIAYYNSQKWLNPEIASICREKSVLMIDSTQKSLNEIAAEYNGIIYSPIIDIEFATTTQTTYISTIHGLRVLEMPFDTYVSEYKDISFLKPLYRLYYRWKSKKTFVSTLKKYRDVFNCKNFHSITVSEHSKASILSFIPHLKSSDLQVFYSPSTVVDSFDTARILPYSEEKYYLIVSADRWIKNSLRALIAFDEIFTERPDFKGKVIITGINNKNVFKKHIKNTDRFILVDYVDEPTLASLYKGAYLFVYPSLNEGFGYPPLEAMAHGTPIITSAISSIPEICGDSVLYFNPLITNEIKMRVLQMENLALQEQLKEKMAQRLVTIKTKQDQDLDKLTSYIMSFV